VLLLEYDMLTTRPSDVFKLVYEFLGEAPYPHDFAKVEYDAPEFDAQLGMDGLHRVRPQVKPQSRATILPPDLFRRYAQLAFWRDLKDSKAFRIVRQPSAEKQSETMPAPAPAITPEAAN
jgi:sulfotransferase